MIKLYSKYSRILILFVLQMLLWQGDLFGQTVNFKVNINSGCKPLGVSFTDLSSPSPVAWNWTFGNGSTSTVRNPSTVYADTGIFNVTLEVTFSNGQKISATQNAYIKVYTPPTSDFSSALTSGCMPFTANFANNAIRGSAPIDSFFWDFGTGQIGGGPSPKNVYGTAGMKTVTLIVRDTNKCTHTVTKSNFINVFPKPTAAFSSPNNNACDFPHTVNLMTSSSANTTGSLVYKWIFDNNQTSTVPNPSVSYNSAGLFDITLVVTNALGCKDTLTKPGFINIQELKADFNVLSPIGCPLLRPVLQSNVTPQLPGNKYEWTISNGMTSHSKDTSLELNDPGSFTVKLKFTAPNGCSDSMIKANIINVLPVPDASFTATDSIRCKPPLNVTFNATGSNIASYNWSLGGGVISTLKSPLRNFTDTGIYTIMLIVTAPNGCSDTVVKPNLVKVMGPKPSFLTNPPSGCAPLNVAFISTTSSVSPIASYQYRYGNNKSSYGAVGSTNYEDTGVYFPKLIVTTVDGCTDTSRTRDSVMVGGKPVADFTTDSINGCRNMKVRFQNLTNDGPVKADKYRWDFTFGSSNQLNAEHPEMVYDGPPKKYDVKLIVWSKGCSDTMIKTEYININPPQAALGFFTSGCAGDSFVFVNNSVGLNNKYLWEFGDGDTSTKNSPAHVFPPGSFWTKLTATDQVSGCVDTLRIPITVINGDLPKFKLFRQSDTAVCTQTDVWFMDDNAGKSTDWLWEFSDGQTSTRMNATMKFSKPGWISVKFTAMINGCRFTNYKPNFIRIKGPDIQFQNPHVVCAPDSFPLVWKVRSDNKPVKSRTLSIRPHTDYPEAAITSFMSSKSDTIRYYFDKTTMRTSQSAYRYLTYTVIDSGNCLNLVYDSIQVFRPKGKAQFDQLPNCIGSKYVFDSEQTDTLNPGPHRYRWIFGDTGSIATTDTMAEYVYHQSGNYVLKLVTYDSASCTDTLSIPFPVTVKNLDVNWGVAETYKPCPPFIVQFNDSTADSYNGIVRWQWKYTDGSESEVANPVKVFTEPGKYGVSLKVTDALGCTDSLFIKDYISLGGTKIGYDIDILEGCEPLEVKVVSFSTGSSNVDIKWLMGDGSNILDSDSFTHTFQNNGLFLPVAFISDSTGCQYALSVNDTVRVFESPKAEFDFSMSCFGTPTNFQNNTVVVGSNITYLWEFEPSVSTGDFNPSHVFSRPGEFLVKLTADNIEGCGSSLEKVVTVPFAKGKVETLTPRACAESGLEMKIVPQGIGATTSVKWIFDDGDVVDNTDTVITHIYRTKGVYFPKVVVENEYGCTFTSQNGDSVIVGDNFPPPPPVIYRASVKDDYQVEVVFEANHSVDFEKYILFRKNVTDLFDSLSESYSCQDSFFVNSSLNTLYNTYTYLVQAKNFCGYYSPLDPSMAHQTVEVSGYTADDASYIDWNAYEGWTPKAYEIYRMDDNGNYIFLKQVDGSVTEAWDSAIVCNKSYRYKVKAVGPDATRYSFSDTTGATPNYIPFVPSNELLAASIEGDQKILVSWTPSSGGKVPVSSYRIERSRDGIVYKQLPDTFTNSTFSAFDMVDSASKRSFYYRVTVKDVCGYISKQSNYGKTIIATAKLNADDRPFLQWSPYEDWTEGVQYYFIEIFDNGSFVPLAQIDGSITSFTDDITPVNSRPDYCYRITAYSPESGGKYSKSNIICAPVVSRLFVPNAFNPEGHPDNRIFLPKGMYVSQFSMKILNRWGETVFTTNSMEKGWDGTYKGSPVQEGVFIYVIEYTGADGENRVEKGTITLLR